MPESQTEKPSQKQFYESLVTRALAAYLGEQSRDGSRMGWLFDLTAKTPEGDDTTISTLCGFGWDDTIEGGAEAMFRYPQDKGEMAEEQFKRVFWGTFPDFRYWTPARDKQLIIEAKGLRSIGRRDISQSERYFQYFLDSGFSGALIYFVPEPDNWVSKLADVHTRAMSGSGRVVPFGAVNLNAQVVPKVSDKLVRVAADAVVQAAELLKTALGLPATPI